MRPPGARFRLVVIVAGAAAISCAKHETSAPGPPVVVESRVDKSQARIGDLVTYRISADHLPSVSIDFPAIASGIGGFDVAETGSDRREEAGRIVEERWFRLRSFDVGRHEIPEAVVRTVDRSSGSVEGSITAPAIAVEITSLLPEGVEAELRDVKSPMDLPREKPRWAIWAGLLVLLAGIVGTWLIQRRRRDHGVRPATPEAAPLPPHEIALRALQALRSRDLPGKGEFDRYTVELTDIVRRYIEARFRVSAPEMTTDEFLAEVSRGRLLEPGPSDLVKDVLRRADLVKFAAYRPTRFEADELLAAAERFVQQTQELAPAVAAEAVAA